MNSENNSFLDLQGPMSTMNRDTGAYGQPLLTQMNTERERKSSNFTSQQNFAQKLKQQDKVGEEEEAPPPVQKFPSDFLIKNVHTSNSQNKIEGNPNDLPEFLNDHSNFRSSRKIGLGNQQNQLNAGSIAAGSNQSSQNFLVSPSNTFLMKEGEEMQNMLDTKQIIEGGIYNKSSVNKLDSETQQKQGGSSHQQEDNVNYNNSQSIRTVNTFLDKLTFKSKSKNTSQLLPSLFHKSGGLTKINSITPEKSVEQNLTKMVKFVKLKKKITEMKRFFLKSYYYKLFLSQFDGNFAKVIDDPSSSMIDDLPQGYQILNCIMSMKIFSIINIIFKAIPTIEPSSKFKLIWDLVIGTVFMTYFFIIPIHVAINVSIHNLITKYVGYILHLLMVIDIVFSMVTGYFEKGVNTSEKKKIIIYYIKNYFWSDIISQIPLLVSELGDQDSQVEKIFVLCFFVKLRNFQKIFRKFEDSFHLKPSTSNIISLVKLILTILFFSHIFGCIWLFVGKYQAHQGTNWLRKIDMEDENWLNQYIAAYYFSTVTMITVGYGDISPMNNIERLVCMGTMLISCVIFAYTINQIGTIFSDLFSQDRQMKEFFYIINDYMDNKNINFSLQYKIREYLDYYWREQDQNKSELEKKIIDSLSDQLREKLMIEANRIVLKNYGIFSNNFHNSVILKMIPIIQTLHTTPNQIIFQEGSTDDDMFIYFIEKGKVEICREYDQGNGQKLAKIVSNIGPGTCFGAYSFFTNQERREMARSLEFSKLLMVRRSDFLELIVDLPQEMEKFNNIRDTIIFENNLEFLEVKCQCCQSYNHEIQHCHYFHYSPDKYVIIKRDNLKYEHQSRDLKFLRKRIQSYRNLSMGGTQNKIIEKWKAQNEESIEQYQQQYLIFTPSDFFDENNFYQDEALDDEYYEDEMRSNSQEDDSGEGEDDEEDYEEEEEEEEEVLNDQSSEEDSSSDQDNHKKRRRSKKNSKKNPSTIKEENENELTQSYQQPKKTNMERINEELNMSIKNSDEIEPADQQDMRTPKENYDFDHDNENVKEKKRQITNIINRMQFSKLTDLIEQDESTPSNKLIGSEKGSARVVELKRLDKLLLSLGKEGNSNHFSDEVMATSNFAFAHKESIPLSNNSIHFRKNDKTLSLVQKANSPQSQQQINVLNAENLEDRQSMQELNLRRPGFKQLTVFTNKNSSEAGSMRTLTKITSQQEQSKQLKQQQTLKALDHEISIDHGSYKDLSPQLICIAAEEQESEDEKKKNKQVKNNFIFETINQIDDFNFEEDEGRKENSAENIIVKESKPILVKKASNISNTNQNNNLNNNLITNASNNNNPIKVEEKSIERKVKKQKSVRINDLNENQIRRKSSKRSQSQISGTESEGFKKINKLSESSVTDVIKVQSHDTANQKRRKSSRIKNHNDFNINIEEQSKLQQENASPLKKNKIDPNNMERKRKRSINKSHGGFELIRNISTLTDSMQKESNNNSNTNINNNNNNQQILVPSNPEKTKRKSQQKNFPEHEIRNPDSLTMFSPNIQRRQLDKLEKQRSQSFKGLNLYATKSNATEKPHQQVHVNAQGQMQQSSQMQGSKLGNQIGSSLSSRQSINQSIQNAYNQQNVLFGQSSLADITSQNSLPQNQQSQTKFKKDKNRSSKSGQPQNLLSDLQRFEGVNNSSQNELINPLISLQRKDSSDSQRSNSSSNFGGNNQQLTKKKSVFSKENAKSKLPTQSSFSKQMNMLNMKNSQQTQSNNQPQYLSPYPQNNNLLIPGLRQQNSNRDSNLIPPPSPLHSPTHKNANVKSKVMSFINKAKNASKLNRSNNESISSHQRSKQGEISPKSAMSTKQMMILNQMMNNNKIDTIEDQNYQQRKNIIDQQNLINARKNSSLSINSVSSIQQIRSNLHGLGRNNYKQMNEIGTPLLKVSGETLKGSNQGFQGRQQLPPLPTLNMKQSILGLPIQMQQSQYHNLPQMQLKDRSPTLIHPDNPLMNMYHTQNAQTYMSLNQTPLPNQHNQQGSIQGYFNYNNESGQNNNYDQSNEETIFNIMEFEEMKFFQHYFSKGNFTRVISKANAIISRKFVKFIKNIKKQKQQQKRKLEGMDSKDRRGSFYRKQQLQKKKSYGIIDVLTAAKTLGQNGGGSDEKIGGRSRVNSLAINPQNPLEDSQMSNDSDITANKISQRGTSPQYKDLNFIKFNSDGGEKSALNPQVHSANLLDSKKLNSPMPKSIFNRQNNINNNN